MINGTRIALSVGDEVMHQPTGRIGRATQVLRGRVYVRFEANAKASYLERETVVSTRFLRAMSEVDEDEANERAYEANCAREFALAESAAFNESWARMKNEAAQFEREQEEAAFMSDPDLRSGYGEVNWHDEAAKATPEYYGMGGISRCPNANPARHCMAHDYDHILEARESGVAI